MWDHEIKKRKWSKETFYSFSKRGKVREKITGERNHLYLGRAFSPEIKEGMVKTKRIASTCISGDEMCLPTGHLLYGVSTHKKCRKARSGF